MVPILQSLFAHQAWADTQLLDAVAACAGAYDDPDMRRLLHHIYVVQRFFHTQLQGLPIDLAVEMALPETLEAMTEKFRDIHARQAEYMAAVEEDALAREVDVPLLKGVQPTVGQILTQVVMHSQGHRGQCLTRLRQLGATPPTLDYILWAGRKVPIEGK